jgi:hypothetical protein
MVRRHGSQSPVSCQSPRGIFAAPVPCKQPTAWEGPEGDVPHPRVNRLEPDVLAGPAAGDVHPRVLPPTAPVGTAVADVDTVGVRKGWAVIGHLTRRGGIA